MDCTYCGKTFNNKYTLGQHQKTAKYCLELQGSKNVSFNCDHCNKKLCTNDRLQTHYLTCKEKTKNDIKRDFVKENEELRKLLLEKDVSIQRLLQETRQQYEEKLSEKDKQIAKLEDTIRAKDKSIVDIAVAKSSRSLSTTNNTTNNNNITVNYTINLNDIDRLNRVIEQHMTQSVIRGGIPSFTRMLRKNYLSSPEGELAYKCTDIARQKFELIDENGNRREDARADELREALEKSNLEEKTKRTAKEAWMRPDGTCNNEIFNQLAVKAQEIAAITEQEGDCNAKFRSELAVQASKYKK
jgi:hypothetical protein